MRIEKKSVMIGILSGLATFLIFGIPTALIPTGIYIRMIEATLLDYYFFLLSSVLIGVYVGLWHHNKYNSRQSGNISVLGGGVSSFLAVSCPICNVILVSLIGVSSVMVFIEPLRPVIGIIGIALLGIAVYYKYREFRRCDNCGEGKHL